jgi:hypothetical protein
MSYVLVMYIYAGMMAKGDSVTLSQVDGFTSMQSCQEAGKAGERLVGGSTKEYRFVCLVKK